MFTFKKFIKNLANIEDEINMIIDINPKERPHITISISNEIMKPMLVFYVHHDVIFKLTEKYQPQILDELLSKYSKHSRSVREIEDQY